MAQRHVTGELHRYQVVKDYMALLYGPVISDSGIASVSCKSLYGNYSVLSCEHPLGANSLETNASKVRVPALDKLANAIARRSVCFHPGMTETEKAEEVECFRVFTGAVLSQVARSHFKASAGHASGRTLKAWQEIWDKRETELTDKEKSSWNEYVMRSMVTEEDTAGEAAGGPESPLTSYSSFVTPIIDD